MGNHFSVSCSKFIYDWCIDWKKSFKNTKIERSLPSICLIYDIKESINSRKRIREQIDCGEEKMKVYKNYLVMSLK